VISAALWLRRQPGIDPDRIGVLGASHGGNTAVWVTKAIYEKKYPGLLKAAVDYYGACRVPERHGTVPLLVLAGEADNWGNPAGTCQTFARKLRPDQPFELHTYPNVVHGFDNPRLDKLVLNEGHALLYDQAAAEDSYQRVRAFLARWMVVPNAGN
jgi:dienelactone hydrolase